MVVPKTRKDLASVAVPLLFWTSPSQFSSPSKVHTVFLQDAWNLLVYTSKVSADLVIFVKSRRAGFFRYF